MAERHERALAIDVDVDTVRGIMLAAGSTVVAGGYAQLALGPDQDPAVLAARIAAALDPESALPVVVCCHESHGDETVEAIVAAISAAGFAPVSAESRIAARHRSNPSAAEPAALEGIDIPPGLLTSHDQLTLDDLAAVTGAGLGLLVVADRSDEPDAAPQVHVWSPEKPAPRAPTIDPFTSAPIAAAAPGVEPVDDVTMPADRSGRAASATDAPDQASASADEDTELSSDTGLASERAAAPDTTMSARAGDAATVAPPAVSGVAVSDIDGDVDGDVVTSAGQESSRRLLALLVAAAVLALVLALVVLQCGGDDVATIDTDAEPGATADAPAATDTSESATSVAVAADDELDPTVAPEPTAMPTPEPTVAPTAVPTPTEEPTAEPTSEPTADPLEGLPPLASLPERGAIFRPPTLFLEGAVQTQEQADALYGRAIAVVGPDNVVNNYVVRPDAPPALDGNVRVEQAVLFETGSSVIAEQFIPTLELGVAVMALNPQVQMVVQGHTDSVGSDESNLVLSKQRAQAVVDYLVSRGVDLARLEAVGLGEAAPVAPNDSGEGRQINRRIEVDLLDLLAGE